jgi:acyl dehydratase
VTVRSPGRTLTARDADALVALGGYTHPLFTSPTPPVGSPFGARPLPGQALLLLMGGLAERSGVYDEATLALVGFDLVRFHAPLLVGQRLAVEVQPPAAPATEGERRTQTSVWRAVRDDDGTLLAEAVPRFLVRGAA